MEEITDLTVNFFGKFGRTRWLSVNPILKRILEQLPNLKEYFCNFMPAQKDFRQQMRSPTTKARYDRIVKALLSPTMKAYVLFTIDICSSVFEPFMVKFQEKTSLVHLLYDSLGELVFKLMARIFCDDQLSNGGVILQLDELLALDMDQLKSRELVDITNKCTKYMEECKDINERLFKAVNDDFREAIKKSVLHLADKLPKNNKFLQCVRSINPKSVAVGSKEDEIEKLAKLIIVNTIKSKSATQRYLG
jgi:arsenate reductase-like glutaredoxin family protein